MCELEERELLFASRWIGQETLGLTYDCIQSVDPRAMAGLLLDSTAAFREYLAQSVRYVEGSK